MNKTKLAAFAAALLLVSGCALNLDRFGTAEEGYVADPASHTAAVDWTKAETATIKLSDFAFTPNALDFKKGTAYRLRLENTSDKTHYFAAEDFFKAIAVAKLVTAQGEETNPYVKLIAVPEGETKELDFVAVNGGAFDLLCTAPLHAILGMRGTIRIL